MSQPGSKQHIIPASHIGSFSNSTIDPKRKRPIWFRRDGAKSAVSVLAESVGSEKISIQFIIQKIMKDI